MEKQGKNNDRYWKSFRTGNKDYRNRKHNKQQMQNMLDALNNEERRIQEKVKGQEVKGKPIKSEKDW